MFKITEESPLNNDNISALIVKNEPIIKKEVCDAVAGNPSSSQKTEYNYEISISGCPIGNVKVEVLDEASLSEDEGSVVPGCSPHTAAWPKQELDASPTELQSPNIYYTRQPCRPDPDLQPLQSTGDAPRCRELLSSDETSPECTRHPSYGQVGDSEGRGSIRQHNTMQVKIEPQPAHTDASEHRGPVSTDMSTKNLGLRAPETSNPHATSPRILKYFECDYCHKVFSSKSILRSHVLSHKNDQPSTKNSCQSSQLNAKKNLPKDIDASSRLLSLQSSLFGHVKVHKRTYKCKSCGELCGNNFALSVHKRLHADEKPFECKSCGKKFNRNSNLTVHMQIHTGEKSFMCKSCGKGFRNKYALAEHTRVHTGEKPFECKFCGKNFNQNSHLNRHIKIHTGEKPFDCKSCGKRFSDNIVLSKHMRVHTGEKPFECNSCGKSFSQYSNLSRHRRVHADEKPFACKSCDKKFTNNFALTKHTRVHTGEKPFECKMCGKKFSINFALTEHMRMHTDRKPFECKSCGKNFNRNSNLARHKRVHTDEKTLPSDNVTKQLNIKKE